MGVTTCNQCLTRGEKEFSLNGQVQTITTLKEILRQLPVSLEGKISNNRMLVYQKTLTPTSSSAIFPFEASTQFCFTCANNTYNLVEQPTLNTYQPNFMYIMTDAPVLAYFGYVDISGTPFVTPGASATPLDPQPKNINGGLIINGYFLINTYNVNKKVAPTTTAELSAWTYSTNYGGASGSWSDSTGYSDASILFPLKIMKLDAVDVSSVMVFACQIV
jgi:hypothetical protein